MQRSGPSYTCNVCGRSFGRLEHRNRHLTTHSAAKPYRCDFCDLRFQRTDALRRHVENHCPKNQDLQRNKPPAADGSGGGPSARQRVGNACDACHDKKLKCDGAQPCTRCLSKKQACRYSRSEARQAPEVATSQAYTQELPRLTASSNVPPLVAADLNPQLVQHVFSQFAEPPVAPADLAVPSHSGLSSALPARPSASTLTAVNSLHETGLTPGSSLDSLPEDGAVNTDFTTDSPAPASVPTGSGSDSWMSLDFLDELDDDFELMDFLPAAILEQHNEMISALENFRVAFNKDALDDQLVQHLQVPLIPRQYDTELLNILINIFMKHVSGSLSSLKDFQITTYTTVEQILAMAAVGELFVKERASVQLSKLLFTDASRVIYTKNYNNKHTPETVSGFLQAFIILDLFGVCTHHKRAFEVSEAYHCALIQALHYHHSLIFSGPVPPTPEAINQQQRLVQDVILVGCYRFSLHQQSPIMTPESLLRLAAPGQTTLSSTQAYIINQLFEETSLNGVDLGSFSVVSIHDVALVGLISSYAAGQWMANSYEAKNRKWQADVFDRFIAQILRSSPVRNISTIARLCHMIGAALHTPFEYLRDAAYARTTAKTPAQSVSEVVKNWQLSADFDLSLDHAVKIIQMGLPTHPEAPHDALCLFNAGLVVWASSFRGRKQRLPNDRPDLGHLAQAAGILSRMSPLLALNYCKILNALNDENR